LNKQDFWKGKAVLVTGASGFIGSHLTDALVEQGAEVSAFVRNKKAKHFGNLSESGGRIKNFLQGDIANKNAIRTIKENNPAIIFHLAADAHVNYSFEHPMQVMRTNLLGTLNVLHAAMQLGGIQQVVCTSSCQVYGSAAEGKIDESYPLNPESPYAASKAAADRYCYAYWKAYGLPIAIIRPFNSFGPRAEHDVITKFINLACATSQ
jgi:nucleoside-diphosphate-sugar epimerase